MKKIIMITPEYGVGGIGNGAYHIVKNFDKKIDVIVPEKSTVNKKVKTYPVINIKFMKEVCKIIVPFIKLLFSKYDYYYSMSITPSGVVTALLSKFKKGKTITHARGVDVDKTMKEYPILFKWVLKNNDYVFALSDDHIKKLNNFYHRRYYKITNGVEEIKLPSKKNLRKKLNINKFSLVVTSRLEKHKGINYLIKIVNNLDINLYIIGKGREEKYLKKISRENIIFCGWLKREKALEYVKACDVAVFPQTRAAGMGNSQLEAMILKTPIIGSNVGFMPELLSESRGFLVKPKNTKELKKAIILLKENKKMKKEIIKKAYKHVKKNHNWKNIVKEIEKIVRD